VLVYKNVGNAAGLKEILLQNLRIKLLNEKKCKRI
jgi:hypothetical protein